MLLLCAGVLVGGFIGWFSYAHQKLFFATLGSVMVFASIVYAKVVVPALMGAAVRGVDMMPTAKRLLDSIPDAYREAIALALVCALVARIATWMHARVAPVVQDEEKVAARQKKRVLKQYGQSDTVDEYRREKAEAVKAADVMGNMRALYGQRS